MSATPLLFISDAPDGKTGLGRITRDLASLTARLPQFRVGVLGLGGRGSRQLPFAQYHIQWNMGTGEGQWGEWSLPEVWADFAGREFGIVFTIWDASRMHWFARPQHLSDSDASLRDFLRSGHFARWGYFPIDGTGPGDRLTAQSRDTLIGYDRLLTYSKWARDVVARSVGTSESARRDLDWMPHGLNAGTFCIRDKQQARSRWSDRFHEDDIVVGTVATNQDRKDWGLVAMLGRLLRERYGRRLKLWWHTDTLVRSWSIPALMSDYGLADCTFVTQGGSDTEMAWRYAACDLTVHPGPEGFGYPIAESLSCGVPAVHMNFAGGAEIVQRKEWLVEPSGFRLDTQHNVMRPVFEPHDWLAACEQALGADPAGCRSQVEHLSWPSLWEGAFKKWLLRGVGL